MTVTVNNVLDERNFVNYIAMRNAPRDTLTFGVQPNSRKALGEYDLLTAALTGGNETIEDLSAFYQYHVDVIGPVLPFITALQVCMQTINDTMHIVNLLAVAQGKDRVFGIEPEEIDVMAYITTLQGAIATLTATAQATQQAAQLLAGGNDE